MAVFRVERNTGYTVMSNHHLRNSTAIRAGGHLRYPVGRKDCLYRKKRQYACAHGAALCVALPSKSTQI